MFVGNYYFNKTECAHTGSVCFSCCTFVFRGGTRLQHTTAAKEYPGASLDAWSTPAAKEHPGAPLDDRGRPNTPAHVTVPPLTSKFGSITAFFRLRMHLQSLYYSCSRVLFYGGLEKLECGVNTPHDFPDGQRHAYCSFTPVQGWQSGSNILLFRIISFIHYQCNFIRMRLPSANLQYVYWLCSYKSWLPSLSYISNASHSL